VAGAPPPAGGYAGPGTAAVFITWQHRHAVNADALAGSTAPLGPAWAIGGWFVITAAAAVLAAVMVRTLSRHQTERATALASASGGYGAPLPQHGWYRPS
jgi:hypothetical protein